MKSKKMPFKWKANWVLAEGPISLSVTWEVVEKHRKIEIEKKRACFVI